MKLVNTTSRLRRIEIGLDAAALFDVLLLAIMLTLLSSKYICATGMPINLENIQSAAEALPITNDTEKAIIDADVDVLSAKGDSMLIFDGAIYTINSFRYELKKSKPKVKSRGTLLIKADKNLSSQALINICEAAKLGGFKKAIIAARPNEEN